MPRSTPLPSAGPLADIKVGEVVMVLVPIGVYEKLSAEARARDLRPMELLTGALDEYLARHPRQR